MVALLWTATARAQNVKSGSDESIAVTSEASADDAVPSSAVTPIAEDPAEARRATLRREKNGRSEGLLIGGVVTLVLGAGQLIGGGAYMAKGPGYGSLDAIFGVPLIVSGGLGLITGGILVGVSQIPIQVQPSVAGQPGLTLSGRF
jgi:hypothetical protein